MADNEFDEQSGVNRRTLIKRAAIVTAGLAAWATPSVTSLGAKAYAAGSAATGCQECGLPDNTCFGQVDCGNGCLCSAKFDGTGCVCAVPIICTDNPVCSSDADCATFAPGSVCLSTCCLELRCFVPCGTTPHGAAPRTAAGAPQGRSSAPTR
jgi:hypothetical protein